MTGRFRHDQEMLVGPRMREGEQGYIVVTPLERDGDEGAKVLVNRGWISKANMEQSKRRAGLPTGEVRVEGMLRKPWKKNMFTPDNRPETGEFYFPDVKQMAELTGSQAVWVEETMGGFTSFLSFFACFGLLWMGIVIWIGLVADASSLEPDYFQLIDYQQRGIPIGRPAEVNLRNTHAQYIFTW
jgi:surfeit locus 1 family protein